MLPNLHSNHKVIAMIDSGGQQSPSHIFGIHHYPGMVELVPSTHKPEIRAYIICIELKKNVRIPGYNNQILRFSFIKFDLALISFALILNF